MKEQDLRDKFKPYAHGTDVIDNIAHNKHLKLKEMELLNGKAKELFEIYVSNKYGYDSVLMWKFIPEKVIQVFLVDWLEESIGYYINAIKYNCPERWSAICDYHIGYFQSRQEATTEAIKKAVELINESNGK